MHVLWALDMLCARKHLWLQTYMDITLEEEEAFWEKGQLLDRLMGEVMEDEDLCGDGWMATLLGDWTGEGRAVCTSLSPPGNYKNA